MNKEITIIDLAKKTKWSDVDEAIKYFYPDDKNNYKDVLEKLASFKKAKPKHEDEYIEITAAGFYKGCEEYPEREDQWYNVSTNKFSLSFRKWREVASLPISEDTLEHYLPEDILAHFIWEITFYGPEREMKKQEKEIFKRVKEFKCEKQNKK